MESYPKFHNEVGVSIVRIGCREFKCIGDKPPQDHPHIYLKMGDAGEIVCIEAFVVISEEPPCGHPPKLRYQGRKKDLSFAVSHRRHPCRPN
jgi:uncharacterized Zn-finger protein